MVFRRLWWCFPVLFLCVSSSQAGEEPAKPGARAVLEVEFLIDAKDHRGNVMKDTNEREWRIKRVSKSKIVLEAQPLQRAGVSDPSVGQRMEAMSADIGKQAEAMQAEHGDTLENMEKEMDKCGEDEDCMMRVAQKLASNPEFGAISGKSAAMVQQGNEMVAAAPPRFQPWLPVAGKKGDVEPATYEYVVDEWSKNLRYDPICFKSDNICVSTRQRKGSGTSTMPLYASVEIDTEKNLISLDLGLPIQQLTMTEDATATDQAPQHSEITRQFIDSASDIEEGDLKLIGLPLKGSFRSQSGEKVIAIGKGVDDYPGPIKMNVRWRFTVQQ